MAISEDGINEKNGFFDTFNKWAGSQDNKWLKQQMGIRPGDPGPFFTLAIFGSVRARLRGLHSSTFQPNLSRVGHTSPCPSV